MSNFPYSEQSGWIEVICGCMFAGKSEELIRRLKRVAIAKQKFQLFKPSRDDRYSTAHVTSHDQNKLPATAINEAIEILNLTAADTRVVGIDEAQFLDEKIVEVCEALANGGKRVIVAGLDLTFEAKPFNSMPALMALAESITKTQAICLDCGTAAYRSLRTSSSKETVQVGNEYIPLCRACFHRRQHL